MDEQNLQGQYAGCVSRIVGFLVDVALVTIFLIVAGWLVTSTLGLFRIDLANCPERGGDSGLFGLLCVLSRWALIVAGSLTLPVYLFLFWTLAGQTLGKWLVGVRVVRLDGRPMTGGTAFRRLVGYFITLITLGLGFLWVLVDDRRQALHDKIAGTGVIYAWEARQSQRMIRRLLDVYARWKGN